MLFPIEIFLRKKKDYALLIQEVTFKTLFHIMYDVFSKHNLRSKQFCKTFNKLHTYSLSL